MKILDEREVRQSVNAEESHAKEAADHLCTSDAQTEATLPPWETVETIVWEEV